MNENQRFRLCLLLLFSAMAIVVGCKDKDRISIDVTSKEVSGYGDTVVVHVKSNVLWYVTSDKLWATTSFVSSKGDDILHIAIAVNSTGQKDEAMITFKAGEASAKLVIYRNETTIKVYKVGDLYPDKENPIGMVYEIIHPGMHGKMISLNEADSLAWGSPASTNATDINDGYMNFLTIRRINSTLDEFPAFAWCDRHNVNGQMMWYLPSLNELLSISKIVNTLNPFLQQTPNAVRLKAGVYWSSTESGSSNNSNKAYAASLISGDPYEREKHARCIVRAISTF